MAPLCELQARHGVQLRTGYKNNQACSVFIEYIAKEQRIVLLEQLKFLAYRLMEAQIVSTKRENCFLLYIVFSPTAAGLYESLIRAFSHMGVEEWEDKLIGFGCDGTSVNIAANGLKGLLEKSVSWIVTFWCLAHRLELSIKDSLKSTYFATVDDVLLCIYYLYKNFRQEMS